MTLKAFLFLFAVTIVAVVASAFIAERLFNPGLERGVVIAILSGLVVFPAARWAEYRGWMKGEWSPGGELRKAQDERKERQAREAEEAARPDSRSQEIPRTEQMGGLRSDHPDLPDAAPTHPGDPR